MSVLNPYAAAAERASACSEASGAALLGTNAAAVVTPGGQGTATVTVLGELDMSSAEDLNAVLCTALDEHPSGLVLDLAAVEFLDCASFHAIDRARRHAEQQGCRVTLERSSAAVDLLLDTLELDTLKPAGSRPQG